MKSKEATIRRNLDAEERINRNREINERVLMVKLLFLIEICTGGRLNSTQTTKSPKKF